MEDRAKSCLIRVWNRDICGVEEKSKIDNGEMSSDGVIQPQKESFAFVRKAEKKRHE